MKSVHPFSSHAINYTSSSSRSSTPSRERAVTENSYRSKIELAMMSHQFAQLLELLKNEGSNKKELFKVFELAANFNRLDIVKAALYHKDLKPTAPDVLTVEISANKLYV